jgi:hypothetical protein
VIMEVLRIFVGLGPLAATGSGDDRGASARLPDLVELDPVPTSRQRSSR